MQRIGLFGGTFDPVHHGHLRCALEVGEALRLDEVRLIPCALPPHRGQPQEGADVRLHLLRLAVQEQPGLRVDERELGRAGPSYTVETLAGCRSEWPAAALVLILGADAFAGLPTWHRWRELFGLANIAVATRPGAMRPRPGELQAAIAGRLQEAGSWAPEPAGAVIEVPITPLDISASGLRRRIAEGGNARYLLPDAVLDYIEAERLYRTAAN